MVPTVWKLGIGRPRLIRPIGPIYEQVVWVANQLRTELFEDEQDWRGSSVTDAEDYEVMPSHVSRHYLIWMLLYV